MFAASLAVVLHTLSTAQKLEYLHRLHPGDAAAIVALIDDCLAHHWPKNAKDWYEVAERLDDRQ